MSMELTPTVGALERSVTTVGIDRIIDSSWERSSPQTARDYAAPSRSAAVHDLRPASVQGRTSWPST